MKPCTRVGVDVTKRCNWRCQHCFYRWSNDFNTPHDKPIDELKTEASQAFARGCDHAVVVGWGEPTLYNNMAEFLEHCSNMGMQTSIITNGCAPTSKYEEYFSKGMDHLHLSVHGLGETLNEIAGNGAADRMQSRAINWLAYNKLPWRANMTLQRGNYKQAPEVAAWCALKGVYHFVLLGFLPHYEWSNKRLTDYIVHPATLRPYLEEAIDICEKAGVYVSLKYHPFCHLKQEYWKYVMNARYVLFDPWEWDYGHCGESYEDILIASHQMGDSVSVKGEPCCNCAVRLHCGGWNAVYANAFDGANLKAITDQDLSGNMVPGFYHDQNPVNALPGHIRGNA